MDNASEVACPLHFWKCDPKVRLHFSDEFRDGQVRIFPQAEIEISDVQTDKVEAIEIAMMVRVRESLIVPPGKLIVNHQI